MARKIEVIVYRVDAEPVVEEHEDTLESWQSIVGGYIELVPLPDGLLLLCNEEGKLDGLRYNRTVPDIDDILGDFFVCRSDGDEFASVQPGDLATLNRLIL